MRFRGRGSDRDQEDRRWPHAAELTLELGSDEERRVGGGSKGVRAGKHQGQVGQSQPGRLGMGPRSGVREDLSSPREGWVIEGWKAWPGSLDFTQLATRKPFFHVFEQEKRHDRNAASRIVVS